MIYNVGSLYLVRKLEIEKIRFVPKFLLKKAPDFIPLTFLYSEYKHKNQINVFCFGFASSRIIKLSEKTCRKINLKYVPKS